VISEVLVGEPKVLMLYHDSPYHLEKVSVPVEASRCLSTPFEVVKFTPEMIWEKVKFSPIEEKRMASRRMAENSLLILNN